MPENQFSIHSVGGTIYDQFDAPLALVTIEVYDKDLRSEQLIGKAITDRKGFYKIIYNTEQYVPADHKTPDIFLRVRNAAGALLGESPVHFNVPPDYILDFKVNGRPFKGLPEFDALVQAINPLLERQGLTMVDLVENEQFKDISFIAGETGEDFEKIAFLPIAFNHSQKSKISPDIFFGLFRFNFSTDLNALLLVQSESLLNGLKRAINENIISARWATKLDAIAKDLNSLSTKLILKGNEENTISLRKLLSKAVPDAPLQKVFIHTLFANEATPEKLWDRLATQDGFADGKIIKELKDVLQLHQFTGNVPALAELLHEEQKRDPELKGLRGFTKFNREDWKKRISRLVATGELKTFPEGVNGQTIEEKAEHYANSLENLTNSLFPTDVFARKMQKDSNTPFGDAKADLKTFFESNPDFDLKTNTINRLYAEAKLEGINDKEGLKQQLKKINRVYKLVPAYEQVSALLTHQMDSATAIVQQFSPSGFAEKVAASMSQEEATAIYNKALQLDKRATAIALSFKMRHDVTVFAIDGHQPLSSDYVTLFQDNFLCDCEHCQSVYSPSAYLVDLLNFLRKRNNDNGTAFGKLIERRPDLINIQLTCENTNTPLPYIDLVNELLESVVVNQTTTAYQTASTATELAAFPQNVLNAAYDKLKVSAAAYALPLDLPLETSRLLLDKLGTKRQVLLETFFPKGSDTIYNAVEIALEVLGLSSTDIDIFNGTHAIENITGASQLEAILSETGLTYIELLQVLESYFVNPMNGDTRTLQIISTDPGQPTTCNLTKLTLSGANLTILQKLMRFVRLQKKLNCSVFDLDRLLTAFNIASFELSENDFHKLVLIPISNVLRLKNKFGISIPRVIALFAPLDTHRYIDHSLENRTVVPSLYGLLFRNKAITNPLDEGFTLDASNLTGLLSDHLPVILAALNISPQELNLLLAGNSGLLAPIDNHLNLQNLSELYRRASLAAMLRITIPDFLEAVKIIGINPLAGVAQTAQTLHFIEQFYFIRSFNLTLQELQYLLRKENGNPSPSASIEVMAGVLDQVRQGLRKISNEAGTNDLISSEPIQSIAHAFVVDTFSSAFKTDHATTRAVLDRTVKFSGDQSKSFLTALLSEDFFNNEDALFTRDEFKNLVPALPHFFDSYKHAEKIVFLIKRFKLTAEELIYLTQQAATFSFEPILNNAGLVPYTAFENFVSLIRFRDYLKLSSPPWMEVLDIVIKNEANAKNNFIGALASATTMERPSLHYLLGDPAEATDKGHLNLDFPSDYTKGIHLMQVLSSLRITQKVGAATEEFASAFLTSNSNYLMGLLKSKYKESDWLEVIKPISNSLRIRRRDALAAYLLYDPTLTQYRTGKFGDSNSLYTYLLIDVEMDACMFTSRIKQAISSVQLFVDRSLMNLEEGVLLIPDFSTQWHTWRKQYRVWEANRKVFLYPENWIEPELRDDKTPFFKELESRLKQNEVTDTTAQEALLAYLEKVDTVANLEMVGIFPEQDNRKVHAIGRTHTVPHLYYYRYQKEFIWSPWEKIDVDIEGDHILPVVWNDRLLLFWALFTEKQENDDDGFTVPGEGDVIPPPVTYYEMKLAWSEYKNSGWSSKKVSSDFLLINYKTIGTLLFKKEQLIISSLITGGKLYLRVFTPIRSDIQTEILSNYLGAFYFNNCNSAPLVIPPETFTNEVPFVWLLENKGYDSQRMFLMENGTDPFAVYEAGLYKPLLDGNNKIIHLFGNTPGNVKLRPNHHHIEQRKKDIFFYSNEQHNFYVQSRERLIPPVFDDTLFENASLLIERQKVNPQYRSADHLNKKRRDLASIRSLPSEARLHLPPASNNIKTPGITALFGKRYFFQSFYHPYICSFIEILNTQGINGLYMEAVQNRPVIDLFTATTYNPTSAVGKPYPVEKIDFDLFATYSVYNWELFFHIPLLMATRLTQNQKFAEARKWLHYIFNPTKPGSNINEGVERFWVTKPFKEEIQSGLLNIEELLDEEQNPDLETQISYWENNPFKPHAVARMRLSAYMRLTVMKYIDNLIAWGDNLFQRDTLESINEATLLYILAANILGKQPEKVPARATPVKQSFSTIQDSLDSFSNVKVAVQSFLSPSANNSDSSDSDVLMPMFCIPKNDKLLKYWNTVADRLFKIRHCMNIQGVVRQLPLFEPPIDPALLVRATAMGLDLNSIMNDITPVLPVYRFQIMLQQANELCIDVKALGNELLSALEKSDAEQLAIIRSGHELKMLDIMRDIRKGQRDEAKEQLESLRKSKDVVQASRDYYGSREFRNAAEEVYFNLTQSANVLESALTLNSALASIGYLIPEFNLGPWIVGSQTGGLNLGNATMAALEGGRSLASSLKTGGELASIIGTFQRRKEDWDFQKTSAELELKQLDKEIAAAEINVAIAERELESHEQQMHHAKEVDEYMRNKFTNAELYDYMVGQIAAVFFQSYQLAYKTAKKAEKCLQDELGIENTSFIQFGYWDSLKKGLLSGEKLQFDLRRLENAYMEMNVRDFEITKHISLSLIDPLALLTLKDSGFCRVRLSEELFDFDFPGHYHRRIKSVSMSIPCIAGPYTSVNATLRLLRNEYRIDKEADENTYVRTAEEEATPGTGRFRKGANSATAIATSNAQMDSGVFELNFRDERYLPFEGAGAISEWSIELSTDKTLRQFDYNTIADVILHIRYSAKDGGETLKSAAIGHMKKFITNALGSSEFPLKQIINLKQAFSTAWHRFLHPPTANTDQELLIKINKEHFPFFVQKTSLLIDNLDIIAICTTNQEYSLTLKFGLGASIELDLAGVEPNGIRIAKSNLNLTIEDAVEIDVSINVKQKVRTDFRSLVTVPPEIKEMYLIMGYSLIK